jgi:hypothetical protein
MSYVILPSPFPTSPIPLSFTTTSLASNITSSAGGAFPNTYAIALYPVTEFIIMLENMFLGGVHLAVEIGIALFTIAILINLIKWMMGEGNINSFLLEFFKKLVLMVVLIAFIENAGAVLPALAKLFVSLGEGLGLSGAGGGLSSSAASTLENPFLNFELIGVNWVSILKIAVWANSTPANNTYIIGGLITATNVLEWTVIALVLAIPVILLCLYLAVDFIAVQFEYLFTMCLGIIFLGFLALDATKSYGTNFIKSLVGTGLRLMTVIMVIIMANIMGVYYSDLLADVANGSAKLAVASLLKTLSGDIGTGFTLSPISLSSASGNQFIVLSEIAGIFLYGLIAFLIYMVPKIMSNIVSGSTGAMSAAGTLAAGAAVGGAIVGVGAAAVTGGASVAAAQGISALSSGVKEHAKDHQNMMDELNKKS